MFKQYKWIVGVFVLMLLGSILYFWLNPVVAQEEEPYAQSGIVSTELGDPTPLGRLNVRFPEQDLAVASAKIRAILAEPLAERSNEAAPEQVPAITDEIRALAAGLNNEPLAIYDYVHNHIDYVPSWGLLKNPRETLLVKKGNGAEQAALLAALLEAAGFTPQYVWGEITLDLETAMAWVGATDSDVVGNIFASGGIPTTRIGNNLRIAHVWIEINDGGTRALDPSFKSYNELPSENLRELMGYNLNTFVNQAESGATIATDYFSHLNHTNIEGNLSQYAINLATALREDDPFISLEDLIGGRQIVPIESTSYPSGLHYSVHQIMGRANGLASDFAYHLSLSLSGINYTTRIDDIAGERITIFYECATPSDCATLAAGGGVYHVQPAYNVEVVPKLRVGGMVVATGNAITLGEFQQLDIEVATPASSISQTTFRSAQFLTAGEWYALPMRLQAVSNEAMARHVDLLNEAMAGDWKPDDEDVLGQMLYLLGLSYFHQVGMGDRIDAQIAEIVHVPHFSLMIASRSLTVFVDGSQRPVKLDAGSDNVDVRLNIDTAISAENPARAEREVAWFLSAGVRGSAVEHAILEQLEEEPAISTIQVLQLAMEEGQRIYYITPENWGRVAPELSNHWGGVLNSIQQDLSRGRHIIISKDPIRFHDWEGSGWITYDPDSGSAGYLIAGFLNVSPLSNAQIAHGGSGVRQLEELESEAERTLFVASFRKLGLFASSNINAARHFVTRLVVDPIDVIAGSFVYEHQDLTSLGGAGMPLGFERYYDSGKHQLQGALGYGWGHNYDVGFYAGSDWKRGYGDRLALEATYPLVASQVGMDLFDISPVPKQRFGMGINSAHWLMRQITGNAVVVDEPDGNLATYVRVPDEQSLSRMSGLGGRYHSAGGNCGNLMAVNVGEDGASDLLWEDGRHLFFDANGRLTAADDANGNRVVLSYDANGRLEEVTDAAERSLMFAYDARDRIERISDPTGRTWHYQYDTQGNLQSVTDARGGVTTYGYDGEHRVETVTDPSGVTFVANSYDSQGRVQSQVNGRDETVSLRYAGDHTVVTDALGHETYYFFDAERRLTGVEDALGQTTSIEYDAADQIVSHTNGAGEKTTFTYDVYSHLLTATDSLGHTIEWGYDGAGNPTHYTDQRGQTWQFTYDERHNLLSATAPLGQVFTYQYNELGQLTEAQDPSGVVLTYSYDADGNLHCIRNSLSETACWGYDDVGRATSFINGAGEVTQFAFDAHDNLVTITDALDNVTTYAYDALDNLVAHTQPGGQTTTYTYDAQFNLTRVTDALGQVTTYSYDGNDNLMQVRDANDQVTSYGRDEVGRLVTISDPLQRLIVFHYDGGNRIVRLERADGSEIVYTRDARGAVTGIDYPSGSDIAYTYDPIGNLVSVGYGDEWNATYTYDENGRLITIDNPSRNILQTYEYDPAGRRQRIAVSQDGNILYDISKTFDMVGRLSRVTDQTGDPIDVVYDYDAAGRLIEVAFPEALTNYAYDAVGQPVLVSQQTNAEALIATYGYSYDVNGNVINKTETTPVTSFTTNYSYDALDRLVAEMYPRYDITYVYDPVGNLVERTDSLGAVEYTYDAANQLLSRGVERYGYDAHGNRVSWENERGVYRYAYNAENLLTELTLPDGNLMTYAYDAFGRRIEADAPTGKQTFVHQGMDIILQGDDALDEGTQRYLYGNQLLAGRVNEAVGFTAYHGDGLENVGYLTDSGGVAFAAYQHDAFGRGGQAAGIDPNPFRFVGQRSVYQHDVPGWSTYLMGHRYYGAESGRFVTRDPLPGNLYMPQSLNSYAYATNNPIKYSDPLGLRLAPKLLNTPLQLGSRFLAQAPKIPGQNLVREGLARLQPFTSSIHRGQTVFLANAGQNYPRFPRLLAGIRLFRKLGFLFRGIPPEQEGVSDSDSFVGKENDPATQHVDDPVQPAGGGSGITGRRIYSNNVWTSLATRNQYSALICTPNDSLLGGAFHAGLFRSEAPTNYAQWENEVEASIGEFTVADDQTVYAGSWFDGVWKGMDDGKTWSGHDIGLEANHVYALAAAPNDSQQLFAGTEMGLFASADGAVNWTRPAGNLPGHIVSELLFVGERLLAVTEYGVFLSNDAGASWQKPSQGVPTVRINELAVDTSTGHVYAATSLGLYQSTDAGDSWSTFGAGLSGQNVHGLAVDPANDNHMAVGTASGLFVSLDGGTSWVADSYAGLGGVAKQVATVAFCNDGGETNLYLGSGNGIYALRTPTAPTDAEISGLDIGIVDQDITFTVTVTPTTTTLPIEVTWRVTGYEERSDKIYSLTQSQTYSWSEPGKKTITVTVDNEVGDSLTKTHMIEVLPPPEWLVYLPIIKR